MADSSSTAWIDAMLRERLGPGATLGELGFEGRVLCVERASLPLGALRLEVERAEIELGAGATLGELPLSARLVSLRAVLAGVSIEATAGDPAAPGWFSGTVRVRGAAPRAFDVSASLDVAPVGEAPRDAVVVTGVGSCVAVAVALDASGGVDGSRVRGRVALADLRALGLSLGLEGAVELDLTAHGSLAELALRGLVFAAAVVVSHRARPEAPALRLDNVRASIDVTRRRLRYQELRGEAHGARFVGWGRVPLGGRGEEGVPLAAVAVEGAGVALVRACAALAGAQVRVPDDLTVTGELMVTPSLAASGAFAVETPRTQLLFRLAVAPGGSLVGSTLRGRLAAADAITVGIFSGPVRPCPPAVLEVDARLTGTAAKPGITGRVACACFTLDVSADAAAPSFVLEDASVLLDVDAEGIAWHRLRGSFYGGTFSSSGRAGRASGLHATLVWGGVRVERLPTNASGEERLARLLHGASSGEVRFEHHADAPLAAQGQLALAGPIYLVTRSLRPELARYGLPHVRSRGKGPLSARVVLDRGVLRIESIAAAVDGVEITGDVNLGLDGGLAGRVVVHLLEGYLEQSALLSIPAAFAGRVSVPVELGGTVRAPEVRTDAWQILEGLLSGNRVGEAVKSVLDGLRGVAPKR